jgi:hypothetical protein
MVLQQLDKVLQGGTWRQPSQSRWCLYDVIAGHEVA